ncbi:hypothetical protein [Nocardioides sp.]|uniref:hypothetical protein n=1 Tax=Nocardioides sp. TaxID=35761 RepID=UPI0035622D3F
MAQHDPKLTKQQDQAVRRLLAEARHTEPMPDDVAARLERVLSDLADSPEGPGETGNLVELASRRRRRVASLLVAAAAVVVLGVGLGQLMDIGQGDAISASTADRSTPEDADSAAGSAAGSGETNSELGAALDSFGSFETLAPVEIRPDDFSTDVARTRRQLESGRLADRTSPTDKSPTSSSAESAPAESAGSSAYDCVRPEWGEGSYVPVLYGADLGVLVFREVTGDSQVVDLFSCGSPEVLRSITLPVP